MITPLNFLQKKMSQLPVSQQVTTPSAFNFAPDQTILKATNVKVDGADTPAPDTPASPVPEVELPGAEPTRQTGDEFQDFTLDFMKQYFSPEFRQQLIDDKIKLSRTEMRDAYMMGRLRDMPKEIKQGYQEAGNLIGQGGANIANIMGSTNVPIGDFSGDTIPQLPTRQYFR